MVQTQILAPAKVYIQMETTNQSFVEMHYYLKHIGIKNNDFFLVLYNPMLAGVDPRDPNLTPDMKRMVLREIVSNYWYFLREVVRIPEQGASAQNGRRYQLNRASLAMNFLYILNFNQYVELPRQTGKTTTARVRYLYVYNFGTTNSQIMFIHKAHEGSKENLQILKEIRDMLPSYLKMDAKTGVNGSKLKVQNTIVKMQHPLNGNSIVTFPSAKSEAMADKLGRGCTMPIQFYDEFAFMPYNKTVYMSATPAFKRAADNAKKNNAPYGIFICSTPGDPTTAEGQYALDMINTALRWDESYFDYTYEQLVELNASNRLSSFFYIRYTYKQLGYSEQWFSDICREMHNEWPKIRREILLEWAVSTDNCAFNSEDLDMIKNLCREPIRTMKFGRLGQYIFDVYEDIDLRYPPIIGVDVSGATMHDSSAITIIDSRTTRVVATFKCNFIPQDDLADLIYVLVSRYMPNAVVNVELNGGYGKSVIQRLVKTTIKKNLYFEIKDTVIEESVTNHMVKQRRATVKRYGLNSNKEIRSRLIELLYDRVNYHKDKFVSPEIYNELTTMQQKRNGKVEHADKCHDDLVFSYLMAIYVWYDGENVMENFRIMKNTIKTDAEEEIMEGEIDRSIKTDTIDLSISEIIEESEVAEQLQYLNSKKSISKDNFDSEMAKKEESYTQFMVGTDKVFREAYKNKYGIEDPTDYINTTVLPDSIFIDDISEDDDINQFDIKSVEFHGNLYNDFTNF